MELTPVGRRLYEEVRPAWDQISAAFAQAIDTGRGLTGTLRVAFIGAAGGQLLAGAAELFRRRLPDCEAQLREAQLADLMPWLRDGQVDLALATFPIEEPGIVTGPVLVSEARMLAVPSQHAFARRTSVSLDDLARVRLLRLPDTLPVTAPSLSEPRPGATTRAPTSPVRISDAPPLRWGLLWRADGDTARVPAFAEAARDLVASA
ncbi:LysR family transcriptional regulator [Nonomuraea phyllanthi]|uniref:LysR family transcriptional regulator n=1 Tax=Nonomuraea phyllanthi TaxID=2219224 RepID=UPI001D0274BB|nr:LysR substrate-binding domain-containing protein [Nonomuraea phyllanthi]